MGAMTQLYSLDAWVSSTKPSTNFEESSILQVQSGSRYAFIYFGRSFPLGASIISATLTIHTMSVSGSGTRAVTVRRPATRPVFSRLTWNNAPAGVTGPGEPKTVTKSGALPGGEAWAFDVTSHVQAAASGEPWAGWRVETDSAEMLRVYGYESGGDYRASLEIVWSDAPDAPSQLVPSGGRPIKEGLPWLRWDYTDVSGDTEMSGLQVQVATGEWDFSTPLFDTGQIAGSKPQLNLQDTACPAPADNTSLWWRVRVQDGAGLWSDWSDRVEFKYVAPASFTLVSPAPGGTVGAPAGLDDPTPTFSWVLTGAVQESYRVRVWLNTAPKTPLWDSGRVTSTDTSITAPKGKFRWDDRRYRVQVDVWDNLGRQSVPGHPAAYIASTIVLLDWDATLAGTDTVSALPLDPYPFVELEWTRATAPDGWVITRNSEVVAELDYADAFQADGTNRWVDRYAPPLTELRYVVRPKVNGKTAFGNPTALAFSRPVGVWLVNDTDAVCLQGVEEGTWGMGETVALHEPINGDRVVQVRTGQRGYEGSISGLLLSDVRGMESVSAREWRDAFLRIKRDGGANLIASSLSIPVYTAEMVAGPSPLVEENYNASFAFWQRGRFDWDAL